MNISLEYLQQGGWYKLNINSEEYLSGIFTMNISAEYLSSL